MRRVTLGATLLVAVVVAVMPTVPALAEGPGGPGQWHDGDPPVHQGVHLAMWGGGRIEQAAATPGMRSLWLSHEGALIGYIIGGPSFVNAPFRGLFLDGIIPPDTALLLVLQETNAYAVPDRVVQDFLEALEDAAPPLNSEAALIQALSRLTAQARARMETSGSLAAFMGVQDLPDGGVTLSLRDQQEDRLRVRAVLHYGGGDTLREFLMLRERDRWLIDWVDVMPIDESSSAEQVADAFFHHVVASAPPGVVAAADRAHELLSDAGRAALDPERTLSGALAGFVGIQDIPDQGMTIAEAVVDGDQATVHVTLHYSGGDAVRIVHLVQTAEGWRVDQVTPQ